MKQIHVFLEDALVWVGIFVILILMFLSGLIIGYRFICQEERNRTVAERQFQKDLEEAGYEIQGTQEINGKKVIMWGQKSNP